MPDRHAAKPLFAVIQGGVQKRAIDADLWQCNVCNAEIGIATTVAVKVRKMPFVKRGKLIGGHDVWVCAHCLGRGKITPIQ